MILEKARFFKHAFFEKTFFVKRKRFIKKKHVFSIPTYNLRHYTFDL